jgi:hypothetical protein
MICHSDMIKSLFCIVLTHAEINRFVARLFDKEPSIAWPNSVPEPFYSENPPLVSIIVSFGLLYTCS